MPALIQELRPNRLEQATKHAVAYGCKLRGGEVIPALSLEVLDGEAVLGVALCVRHPMKRHRLEVGLDAAFPPELRRQLIDKALMKLRAAGGHKCELVIDGKPDPAFWRESSWINQTLGDRAA